MTKDNKEIIQQSHFRYDDYQYLDMKLRMDLKDDIHALDRKIDSVSSNLDKKIDSVTNALNIKIDSVKFELKEDIHALDRKIDSLDRKIDNISSRLAWGVIAMLVLPIIVNILSKKLGF